MKSNFCLIIIWFSFSLFLYESINLQQLKKECWNGKKKRKEKREKKFYSRISVGQTWLTNFGHVILNWFKEIIFWFLNNCFFGFWGLRSSVSAGFFPFLLLCICLKNFLPRLTTDNIFGLKLAINPMKISECVKANHLSFKAINHKIFKVVDNIKTTTTYSFG